MLNQVVMIGKICEMPTEYKDANGVRKISFVLEVERPFRESDGLYANDYFVVSPWKGIAEQMKEICKVGYIIAVKGRLCTKSKETCKEAEIIAEQISFLSTRIN